MLVAEAEAVALQAQKAEALVEVAGVLAAAEAVLRSALPLDYLMASLLLREVEEGEDIIAGVEE